MEKLTNIRTVKDLLSRHHFTFSKAMGQNFLINPSVCPRMAEMGGAKEGVCALEIGPGIGVLTHELLKRCDRVIAVELDQRLLPVLKETLSEHDNLEIINADVMDLDLNALLHDRFFGKEIIVCANLPYYITSPVLMKLLEEKLPIRSITVMVQKEAAARLCASPGERACSAISAAVSYYADAKLLFSVSPGSFMPAPKVESAVIRLDLHAPIIQVKSEKALFSVIRAAFSQRRKTILNAISSSLSLEKAELSDMLDEAGVDKTLRAERLTLEDFGRISDVMTARDVFAEQEKGDGYVFVEE